METKLSNEQKAFLKLVKRSLNENNYAEVSEFLMPISKKMCEELKEFLIFQETNDGKARIIFTQKGNSIIDAMNYL